MTAGLQNWHGAKKKKQPTQGDPAKASIGFKMRSVERSVDGPSAVSCRTKVSDPEKRRF